MQLTWTRARKRFFMKSFSILNSIVIIHFEHIYNLTSYYNASHAEDTGAYGKIILEWILGK